MKNSLTMLILVLLFGKAIYHIFLILTTLFLGYILLTMGA